MSDDAEFAAPAEGEAPEAGQGEPEAPPERDFIDTDQLGEHYVRVRVAGEEQEVPLSEALSGYSRTQDYTRKTQELAEQQKTSQFAITLHQALENNPAATLRLLQEQYGYEPDLPNQGASEEADDDLDFDDPVAQRLRDQEARLSHWEAQQAQRELNEALWVLRQRYGDDFDPPAVVSRAAQMGRMDLEGVYKEMAFERIWTQNQAQAQAKQQRAAEDAQRVAAKQKVAVHGGESSNGTVAEVSGNAPTLSDAYYEAKRQLGL